MAYTRNPTWVDGQGNTLITAALLNHLEDGVVTTSQVADAVATQAINSQTGTTYTPVAADAGKLIKLSNASAVTLTIPSATFSAGQRLDILGYGAGLITVAAGSGMTLRGSSLTSRAQYSVLSVFFLSASEAVVAGDLA